MYIKDKELEFAVKRYGRALTAEAKYNEDCDIDSDKLDYANEAIAIKENNLA